MISFSNKLRQLSVASSLALLLVACGSEQVAETSDTKKVASENSAEKSDYMVVVNRPNNMHFVDLSTDEIVRTCQLPDAVLPGTVVMSPDNLTASVLAGRFDRILGVDVNNCDLTFDAKFSYDNVRIKSIGSLAVSTDGEEIYTIHNPTKLHSDHYEVLASQFAVYNAKDGIDAKPTRTFDVPRQINIMAAADDGRVYLSGADVFVIDPKTGQVDTAIASHSHNRSNYGQPDVLTVWPLGKVNNEFVRMYTVPKFTDETQNMDTATFMWGYDTERIIAEHIVSDVLQDYLLNLAFVGFYCTLIVLAVYMIWPGMYNLYLKKNRQPYLSDALTSSFVAVGFIALCGAFKKLVTVIFPNWIPLDSLASWPSDTFYPGFNLFVIILGGAPYWALVAIVLFYMQRRYFSGKGPVLSNLMIIMFFIFFAIGDPTSRVLMLWPEMLVRVFWFVCFLILFRYFCRWNPWSYLLGIGIMWYGVDIISYMQMYTHPSYQLQGWLVIGLIILGYAYLAWEALKSRNSDSLTQAQS